MGNSVTKNNSVVVRRSWPQRIVIFFTLVVISAALFAAWLLEDINAAVSGFARVQISGEVLKTETAVGQSVNFLLIGNDSAQGIDTNDPIHVGRRYDSNGGFNADSIVLLRVDPTTRQAWVLSIPRDLLTDKIIPGSTHKINAALLIGGPQTLIETVSAHFDVEINHYVEVDFLGFRELVDVLGGVPVWFNYPARDRNSGLNIVEPGCHVLDGVGALAYVRARRYEEFVDEKWERVGNSDFGRIRRQQDFMVLAMKRAISRGIRNPTTLANLIDAGASSVVLDSALTPAELLELGQAFSEFNPANLTRLDLKVRTVYKDDGGYVGEALLEDVNEETLNIFRGQAANTQAIASQDTVANNSTQGGEPLSEPNAQDTTPPRQVIGDAPPQQSCG